MKKKIENSDDLRSEILRLKLQSYEQEAILRHDIDEITEKLKAPLKMFEKVGSWFKGSVEAHGVKASSDWVTNSLRIGLPLILNRTLFSGSGYVMKSLVTLFSQKAAGSVNKDLIINWLDKASDWIKVKKEGKKHKGLHADYGIPPDSETY